MFVKTGKMESVTGLYVTTSSQECGVARLGRESAYVGGAKTHLDAKWVLKWVWGFLMLGWCQTAAAFKADAIITPIRALLPELRKLAFFGVELIWWFDTLVYDISCYIAYSIVFRQLDVMFLTFSVFYTAIVIADRKEWKKYRTILRGVMVYIFWFANGYLRNYWWYVHVTRLCQCFVLWRMFGKGFSSDNAGDGPPFIQKGKQFKHNFGKTKTQFGPKVCKFFNTPEGCHPKNGGACKLPHILPCEEKKGPVECGECTLEEEEKPHVFEEETGFVYYTLPPLTWWLWSVLTLFWLFDNMLVITKRVVSFTSTTMQIEWGVQEEDVLYEYIHSLDEWYTRVKTGMETFYDVDGEHVVEPITQAMRQRVDFHRFAKYNYRRQVVFYPELYKELLKCVSYSNSDRIMNTLRHEMKAYYQILDNEKVESTISKFKNYLEELELRGQLHPGSSKLAIT